MISLRVLSIHPPTMNFPNHHHLQYHHHCHIFIVYQTNTHTYNNKRSDHSLAAIRTQTYFYFRTFETQEK